MSSQDWVDRQSVLEPLSKLRNAQSSLGQKRTKLFCVLGFVEERKCSGPGPAGLASGAEQHMCHLSPTLPCRADIANKS